MQTTQQISDPEKSQSAIDECLQESPLQGNSNGQQGENTNSDVVGDGIPKSKDSVLPEPMSQEAKQRKSGKPHSEWLRSFQHYSQLIMAVVEPGTLTLRYGNDYFCRLTGIAELGLKPLPSQDLKPLDIQLINLFKDLNSAVLDQLYRQHILNLVLQQLYDVDLAGLRVLNEPVTASLKSACHPQPRLIEFWLRSEQLKITRIDPQLDEFAELDLQNLTVEEWSTKLIDQAQLMGSGIVQALERRLRLENYQVEGLLLLEGVDVTERETIREITQLLIDRDSILRPEKFRRINHRLKSLFQAQNTVILSAESEQVRLFVGTERKDLRATAYSMQSLCGSHFLRSAEVNRPWNVTDLALDCQTDCERALLNQGVRSLLLIPLVVKGMKSRRVQQLAGVVGLVSDRPYNFDGVDCKNAEELIPALTAAMRQAVQQRFTNIHPAVEWRFLQEAERRSWGLPPEPIVFTDVYPLHGISDIRGSSDERNRSIQRDLLEQFQLGLAVVEAVCQYQKTSLGEQLRLDLLDYIEQLKQTVTVDAEVTALRYLSESLEIYFNHFAQCGPSAEAAVATYRNACANDHKSVYIARAHYDQTINQINTLLRETWDRWQVSMQQIIPHYCDIETTDGINHMIYVGESIDSNFCAFHLRSLRYEQLRAICDCARTAFSLQALYNTKMEVTHLLLVQDLTVDIFHDENTERLFDVRGTRDIRYEIVKKRIDKAVDEQTRTRITQPGMLTLVYSTEEEWEEYQQYLNYLIREGWVGAEIESGCVEPLQGITGLKFARVRVLPKPEEV